MNKGIDLVALATELERRKDHTKDYIAQQGALEMIVGEDDSAPDQTVVALDGLNGGPAAIKPHAHSQLADELGIPKRYYDRMLTEQPELLAENVNTWLKRGADTKRMVRTLDGEVRAILSSSYRPLDNSDLAEAVLPVLVGKGAQVVSSALTETRMYVKAILPGLSDEIPEGLVLGEGHNFLRKDTVVAGIVISNSEVGMGAVRVEPMVFKTRCTNLMIISESKLRKYHVGKDQGLSLEGAGIEELLKDETKRVRDAAFWNTVRDVVESAFNIERFRVHVERMRQAAGEAITTGDLPKVVEVVTERLALPAAVNNSVLKALAAGGDLTQWGLLNAYTNVANNTPDYELATQLERAGGQILELPKQDWKAIAQAA